MATSSPPAPPPQPVRSAGEARWAAGVALLFCAVIGFAALQHEMWRDEWQAWLLARDSGSLWELLRNVRHEGHPFGWYLVLYLLSRVTRDAVAMQLFHVAIAATSAHLIARFAPLPRYQRALIIAGYFMAYEYAVISRGYALGVLGLVLFCVLLPHRRRHPTWLAAALLLLAASSVYGLLLALAALGALLVEELPRRLTTAAPPPRIRHRIIAAAAILFAAGALAGMLPAAERYITTRWTTEAWFSSWALGATLAKITTAYLPFPDLGAPEVWGSSLLAITSRTTLALGMAIALAIGTAATLMFLRKPAVLFLYTVGTFMLLAFSHFLYAGSLRHKGHVFILFLGCLWLARLPLREWRLPRRLDRWAGPHRRWAAIFVTALLLVQAAAAAAMLTIDLRRPFSAAPAAAEVLRRPELAGLPLAAFSSPAASTLAGLLDRPIHYLDIGVAGTFVPWRQYRGYPGARTLTERLHVLVDEADSDVILITPSSVVPTADSPLEFHELARFTPGIVQSESYVLTRVTRAAP